MLWLLRHGEAAEGRPDEARALTERGRADARNVGLALAALGVALDTCLSSPKQRALQTAQLVCAQLGIDFELEPALAAGGWDAERLAAGRGQTLIVAHNPAISGAVRDCSGARVNMRAGGIAGIERGELVVLLTPAELARLAGAEALA